MTSTLLAQQLTLAKDLLALSQAMWLAAQALEWDDLPELQTQREQLIQALFADAPPDGFTDQTLLATLQAIQALDKTLASLVTAERDRIAHELLQLRKSRIADSAYIDASQTL